MPEQPHASDHQSLTEAIIGFVQYARGEGLKVGVQESQEALRAAALGLAAQKSVFAVALRTIFCTSPDEIELFGQLFDRFWGGKRSSVRSRTAYSNQSNIQKRSPGSLVWMGMGQNGEEGREEGRNVSGANVMERLRKTDFAQVAEMDSALLEELALRLWKQMSMRLKRRLKASPRKGQVSLRKTIRANISRGGDLIELRKQRRRPGKQRLVILLDVSGSMDKYSFFLLRFVWALRAHFEKVEAFIFSTRLIRITGLLGHHKLEQALAQLSAEAHNWSSGTKIGACLKTFNEQYARQALSGRATTIILSDGLDTGEPALLASELAKIKARSRMLAWLNPLKGMRGYEPTARGMQAALPAIGLFKSAHNLDSLLELEKYLWHV
ncbi:MAG: VWA domain-containing protein [Phaeodactylibacter sp.]|nr:VWA domain-containing protein [Phaeodactylibacter sp.]